MKRLMRDEKGQALVLTLLLLLIGSLIVTPTLNFMGTGIQSGRVYEQKNDEIYAADAGVEDALWHIRNDTLEDLLGAGYDKYDYSTTYPYPYNLFVNGKNVTVTMQNVWIPKDISTPSPSTARQIIQDEKLLIVGYPSSNTSTYEIKIVCNWGTDTTMRDNLKVKTIGVWLSPGFEYNGSCSLEGRPFYSAPTVSLYKGGQAVVWNFASQPLLKSFPPSCTTNCPTPMEKTFTFKYTSPEAGQIPELLASWIDTTGVTGITYTWDDSIRLYRIVSIAGGVQVEAYGAKTKFRKLKSTISSDYAVAGNRLSETTATSGDDRYYRNRLYADSSSTITRISLQSIPPSGIVPAGKIPEEATIDKVYLYWSGWIDYHYYYSWYGGYSWGEISALKYPSSPTPANLKTLVETSAKVNQVKFNVGGSAQTVTANNTPGDSKWQINKASDCTYGSPSAPYSWEYSCWKDVTDLVVSGNVTVQKYIENAMKSAGSGTVTFTLGHADAVRGLARPGYANYNFNLYNIGQSTGYPLATPAHKTPNDSHYDTDYTRYQWSYAGWSLIIFYSSPGLTQRQLHLYDDLINVPYPGGQTSDVIFTISGFLAPPVISGNDTSHLTYFVGEGDYLYGGSKVKVNNNWLSDPPTNPESDVLNSRSSGLPVTVTDGLDVDAFVLPSGCILPYDTSATITLETAEETYTLVYLVLSFRSELTTGGIITSVKIS